MAQSKHLIHQNGDRTMESFIGFDLPELKNSEGMLLIGSDMAHLLIHLEVVQGRVYEPIAVKTPIGWPFFLNVS